MEVTEGFSEEKGRMTLPFGETTLAEVFRGTQWHFVRYIFPYNNSFFYQVRKNLFEMFNYKN